MEAYAILSWLSVHHASLISYLLRGQYGTGSKPPCWPAEIPPSSALPQSDRHSPRKAGGEKDEEGPDDCHVIA